MTEVPATIVVAEPSRADRFAFWLVPLAAVCASAMLLNGSMIVLIALGVISLAAAVWVRPNVAILLVVFVVYTNAAGVAVKFHGVPLAVAAAFPLLLLWPLFHTLFVLNARIVLPTAFWLALLFVVLQSVGMIFAMYPEQSLKVVVTSIGEGLILFFLIANTVRSRVMLERIVWVLLLAGGLLGMLGCYQHVTGTYQDNYFGFAQVGYDVTVGSGRHLHSQPRLAGPIGVENRHAHLMLMLVPLGLFQVLGDQRPMARLLASVATTLIAFGIGLTYSRGAAIGLVAVLLAMIVFRQIRMRHVVIWSLGAVAVLVMFPEYRARLTSVGKGWATLGRHSTVSSMKRDSSIEGRMNEAVTAGLIFAEHPILGVGPGMYAHHYEDYKHRAGRGQHRGKRLAHNLYLGIAAEQGLLGLGCFFAMLVVTLRCLLRAHKQRRPRPDVNLPLAFLMVLVAYLTTGLFADLAYVRYFWLMLALANAAVLVTESERSPEPSSIGGPLE